MLLLTDERDWKGGGTAVAFGTFDGVHIGHRKLLEEARRLAAADGLTSMAYSYSTHPMQAFRPEAVPPSLETAAEKARALALLGMQAAVLRPFSRAYAQRSPGRFASDIAGKLCLRYAVIGYNYSFGERGSGKAEDLIRLGRELGFCTVVVDEVRAFGETVSSTRIRELLQEGDAALAAKLLGRPYSLCGEVVRGLRLGSALGFATANLAYPPGKVIPAEGVYAALAELDGRAYPAAVNVGSHPTVPGASRIEAHLPGFGGGELYGRRIRLSFRRRLRGERRFESREALQRQIAEDVRCVLAAEIDD